MIRKVKIFLFLILTMILSSCQSKMDIPDNIDEIGLIENIENAEMDDVDELPASVEPTYLKGTKWKLVGLFSRKTETLKKELEPID